MTDDEIKSAAKKKTKKFIKDVRDFIKEHSGEESPQLEVSLIMIENYFYEFLFLTMKLENMDSIIIAGRYGEQPTPLIAARDKAAARLESLLKESGLTLKSAQKIPQAKKKEKSVLEQFMAGSVEKR